MRRKSRLALLTMGLAIGLFGGAAHALGVGDIMVHSRLGNPFHAEILLHTTPADNLLSIKVKNAPIEVYQKLGVDHSPASALQFSVVQDGNDKLRISMNTSKPFNEPVLNFIVQIEWGNGSLTREFTVLLDPS
jgi:pilus assembly protein FimV